MRIVQSRIAQTVPRILADHDVPMDEQRLP